MPMWRCPHCGTPQAETARCWVCRRSSTACGTCRHFRRSVAAQVGYCGLDRRRQPLLGDEIRACWEAGQAGAPDEVPVLTATRLPGEAPLPATSTRRDFIEIGSGAPVSATRPDPATGGGSATDAAPTPSAVVEPRWSLWADLET
jgi:hypothetical protein